MSLFSKSSVRTSWPPEALAAVLITLAAGSLVALMVRLNATLGVHIGVMASSWGVVERACCAVSGSAAPG